MSLVNEALKKARMEAARGDAANSGIPFPALGRGQGPSSGPWTPILAAVLLLLVGLGGIFLYRAGRQSAMTVASEGPGVATSSAGDPAGDPPPTTEPATDAHPTPVVGKRENRPLSATESLPAAAGSAPRTVTPPEQPAVGRNEPQQPSPRAATEPEKRPARERPKPPAQESAPASQPSPTPSEPEASASSEPEVPMATTEYLRSAEIAGVGPIELGGIAWSGDRPFALVNGRVVRPGDSVLGLMIEEIQPNTVRLRGDSGDVVLKLK